MIRSTEKNEGIKEGMEKDIVILQYFQEETKKLNNTRNYKINVDNKLDISYSIIILAKGENNLSNSIIIDISHSNFYTSNDYNKKYKMIYYYLDDTIDKTILDILNKYDTDKYNIQTVELFVFGYKKLGGNTI